jgi:hypothetical protein
LILSLLFSLPLPLSFLSLTLSLCLCLSPQYCHGNKTEIRTSQLTEKLGKQNKIDLIRAISLTLNSA